MDNRIKTSAGDKYNHLTCTGEYIITNTKKRGRLYEWKCDCGDVIWKRSDRVKNGNTKTCSSEECSYRKNIEKI